MRDKDIYYANHYAEMLVQPVEVMQELLSPEGFNGYLFGNVTKYHLRAGHKAGEMIDKEETKMDRYIAWMYHQTKGEKIDPKADYKFPPYYKEQVLKTIDKKVAEMEQERKYAKK